MLTQIYICPCEQGSLSVCTFVVELLLTSWQIELTSLRDLAFGNIRSQLNEKNIVKEFFSQFTARQFLSHLVIPYVQTDLSA